jgi:hypothetical protein
MVKEYLNGVMAVFIRMMFIKVFTSYINNLYIRRFYRRFKRRIRGIYLG